MAKAAVSKLTLEIMGDVSDLQKKIKSTEKIVKNLKSEFNALDKVTKLDPTNVSAFKSAMDKLDGAIKSQKELIDQYNEKIKILSQDEEGHKASIQNTTHARELATAQLQQLMAIQAKYKGALEETNDSEKEATENVVKYDEAVKDAQNTCNAWTVALGNLAAQGIRLVARELKDLSKQVVETGVAFEDGMKGLAAIYGMSSYGSDIKELSDYFRELALTSAYSADEIANNAKVLANAGYTVDQTKNSIVAIQDLAAGTGEDFETMANVVVDGLHAFNLSAEESTHFANTLAKAAVSSNTNVSLMGEAFKYAGTIAGTYGYNIEDIAQAIGVMAANGIKGTQAGTSLRNMITRLAANTSDARTAIESLGVQFYDATGSARPLMDVMNELRGAMNSMTDVEKSELAYKISGQRGLTGLSAIINASQEDWDNLYVSINNSAGAVQRMASTRLDSQSGDVKKLSNAWKELSIQMFNEFEPELRKLTQTVTKFLKSDEGKQFARTFARDVGSALEAVTNIASKLAPNLQTISTLLTGGLGTMAAASAFGKFGSSIDKAWESVSNIKLALSGTATVLNPVSLALSGVALAVGAVATAVSLSNAAWEAHNSAIVETADSNKALAASIDGVAQSRKQAEDAALSDYQNTQILLNELGRYVDANGNVKAGYESRVDYILGELKNATGVEISQIDGVIDSYNDLIAKVREASEEQTRQRLMAAANEQYTDSLVKQKEAFKLLTDSADEYSAAIQNQVANIQAGKDAQWQALLDMTAQAGHAGQVFDKDLGWLDANALESNADALAQYINSATALQDRSVQAAAQNMQNAQSNYENATRAMGQATLEQQALMEDNWTIAQSNYASIQAGIISASDDYYSQMLAIAQEYEVTRQLAASTSDEALKKGYEETLASLTSQLQSYASDPNNLIKFQYDSTGNITDATDAVMQASQAAAAQREIDSQTAQETQKEYGHAEMVEYGDGQIEGIQEKAPEVSDASGQMASDTDGAVTEVVNADTGKQNTMFYLDGMITGLKDKAKLAALAQAAREVANVVNGNVTDKLQIHSPSKVATENGMFYDQGLINGLLKGKDKLASTASDVAGVVNSAFAQGAVSMAGVSAMATTGTTINQNYTFNGSYSTRDGVAAARDLDRLLGEASL